MLIAEPGLSSEEANAIATAVTAEYAVTYGTAH
jgi:hypothetical protein